MKKIIITFLILFSANTQAVEIEHEMGTTTFETTPKKVVALDWVLTETLLGLDITPTAIGDIKGYKEWVSFPELPEEVIDIGDRRKPNLELLAELKPDVILMNKQMAASYEQLSAIAPTVVYSVFGDQKQPLKSAKTMATQLGLLLNKQEAAQQMIAKTDEILSKNGALVQEKNSKSLLFIRFLDAKTIRVHSEGSLVQATIEKMGLTNSWKESTNIWGFSKVGIEKLAEHQSSRIMIFGPLKEQERNTLFSSPLWQAMQFSQEKAYHELPAIWTFGGLIAAQRFSDFIVKSIPE